VPRAAMCRLAALPFLALTLTLLLGACATRERVILLPDAQGRVGKILVTHAGQETLLDDAFGSVEVSDGGLRKGALSEAAVHEQFHPQIAGLPPRPVSYTLYFLGDSDDLTPASREQAHAILREIAARPAAEVVVIGHTDRMGELGYNDQLSLARARAIRNELVMVGFDPQRLQFRGRGEREPVVPTADDVGEPRNRRVEINVR